MTIEIHRPELEALIADGMQSGGYASVEDYLLQALRGSPHQAKSIKPKSNPLPENATGAILIAALQACPYPEVELIQPSVYFTVRDVELE